MKYFGNHNFQDLVLIILGDPELGFALTSKFTL